MTAETTQLVLDSHQSPQRFIQIRWNRGSRAHGGSQCVQLAVIADATLIQFSTLFEDVCLPDGRTCTHRPANWHGDRTNPIGNPGFALMTTAFDVEGLLP